MREDEIFEEALRRPDPADRAAWVARVCADDPALEARVLARLEQRAGREHLGGTVVLPGDRETGDVVVDGEAAAKKLQSFDTKLDPSRVTLRSLAEDGEGPITQPQSAEMPDEDPSGRYRLDGEIARGGMGAILKGRDSNLGRDLAIKVLLASHRDSDEVSQRFVEEAQIAGQLQHPGVTPVYDIGQFVDGRPFFAMKLVKGETLSRLLAERTEPSVDRGRFVGVFEQVCQTMAYVHARGVIHRDLKPANIMVGAFGEVQVMDWGLAKVMQRGGVADEVRSAGGPDAKSIIRTLPADGGDDAFGSDPGSGSRTLVGSVMGTPSYMPPEQAMGDVEQMDERADVFALGAILCEILTGEPPYSGKDALRHALQGRLDACAARLDACDADPELVGLARSCLAPEPADRPRDATVLAEQVTAYLESVETKLRRTELDKVEAQARAEEFVRRRKLLYAIAGILLVGLVTAGFAASHFRSLEQAQRTLTREKSELAAANLGLAEQRARERDAAERATYRATIRHAESMLRGDEKARYGVADLLWATRPELRGWEWGYAMARCPLEEWSLRTAHGELTATAASADGRYLATAGSDGAVALWDVRDQQEVWRRPVGPVAQLEFDPRGRFVALAFDQGADRCFSVLRLADGGRVFDRGGERPSQLAFDAAGDALFVKSKGIVYRYGCPQWELQADASLNLRTGGGSTLFVDRAGSVIGVQLDFVTERSLGYAPRRYLYYDAVTLEPREDLDALQVDSEQLHLYVGPVLDTGRSALVHASGDNVVYRRVEGEEQVVAEGLPGRMQGLFEDLQTGSIVAASDDGSVLVVDRAGDAREIYHGAPIRTLTNLGGGRFVTGSADGLLKCWTLARPAPPEVNVAVEQPVATGALAAFLADGRRIFFKTWKKDFFWLVDADSARCERVETAGMGIANALRPVADEVLVRRVGEVSLFPVASLRGDDPVGRSLPIERPFEVQFDAAGQVMATNLRKQELALFDVESGRRLPTPALPGVDTAGVRLGLSPSGERCAVCAEVGVRVWEVRTGAVVDAFDFDAPLLGLGAPGGLRPAFHPDNAILAVVDQESRVLVRDTEAGQDLQSIRPTPGVRFWHCLFSPDGARLFVACSDSRVRVFDWRDGSELTSLSGSALTRHHSPLAISPDGRTVVYGGHNPSLRIAKALPWDAGSAPDRDFYRLVAELRGQ